MLVRFERSSPHENESLLLFSLFLIQDLPSSSNSYIILKFFLLQSLTKENNILSYQLRFM